MARAYHRAMVHTEQLAADLRRAESSTDDEAAELLARLVSDHPGDPAVAGAAGRALGHAPGTAAWGDLAAALIATAGASPPEAEHWLAARVEDPVARPAL